MKKALLFPGQGSQYVGMGKILAEYSANARLVFEEVDDALGQKLSKIIFQGPNDDLLLTENTQPALMAVSAAVLAVLEKDAKINLAEKFNFLAGHSLGEYSALFAGKAMSLADTAKLLRIRGSAMQNAVPKGQGAMAALIGVDFAMATKIAKEASTEGVCQAANDNGGGQVVISGAIEAIDKAISIAASFGVKRAIKLPVSAPFHCDLMKPAAEIMRKALNEVRLFAPNIPLIANVLAKESFDSDEIKANLVAQVTGTVRWRESLEYLVKKEVEQVVEIGAGKVLSGLCKRINADIKTISVENPEEIEQLLKLI